MQPYYILSRNAADKLFLNLELFIALTGKFAAFKPGKLACTSRLQSAGGTSLLALVITIFPIGFSN